MNGIQKIAKERFEQLTKHGRTIANDRKFNSEEQLQVAAVRMITGDNFKGVVPNGWDPKIWDTMIQKPYEERLIIAGALLAAEIDRISPGAEYSIPQCPNCHDLMQYDFESMNYQHCSCIENY